MVMLILFSTAEKISLILDRVFRQTCSPLRCLSGRGRDGVGRLLCRRSQSHFHEDAAAAQSEERGGRVRSHQLDAAQSHQRRLEAVPVDGGQLAGVRQPEGLAPATHAVLIHRPAVRVGGASISGQKRLMKRLGNLPRNIFGANYMYVLLSEERNETMFISAVPSGCKK